MGAYSNFTDWKSDHNIVFICTNFEVKSKPDSEIAELCAFALNELPDNLWPGHLRRLQEYQAGIQNPQFGKW
jgi:hypothetical protein